METLRLNPGADRRCRQGHLWIFSNELHRPLPPLSPGEDVGIENAAGLLMGSGTFHPGSLIAVRIHAHRKQAPLDRKLLARRVGCAADLRASVLGPEGARYARVVNAEGDYLPGLVVDRYGDLLVAQCLTAAMDRRIPWILDVLRERFRPRGILLRNDVSARELEGLARCVSVGLGEVPPRARVELGPLRLSADPWKGQKTGFYFDQRGNYGLIRPLCPESRVLDAFCYTGAWALHAAFWGAREVTAVDRSEAALALALENARAAGLERIRFEQDNVLDFLKTAASKHRRFDLIVLDPPPYTKSSKQAAEAFKGHLNLHKWALRCVRPGGFLLTCCCSAHVEPDRFLESIRAAAAPAGCRLRVVAEGGQAADHPWVPAMPETAYLKVHLVQSLREDAH